MLQCSDFVCMRGPRSRPMAPAVRSGAPLGTVVSNLRTACTATESQPEIVNKKKRKITHSQFPPSIFKIDISFFLDSSVIAFSLSVSLFEFKINLINFFIGFRVRCAFYECNSQRRQTVWLCGVLRNGSGENRYPGRINSGVRLKQLADRQYAAYGENLPYSILSVAERASAGRNDDL